MKRILAIVLLFTITISAIFAEIIDHNCTDITQIPESAIKNRWSTGSSRLCDEWRLWLLPTMGK